MRDFFDIVNGMALVRFSATDLSEIAQTVSTLMTAKEIHLYSTRMYKISTPVAKSPQMQMQFFMKLIRSSKDPDAEVFNLLDYVFVFGPNAEHNRKSSLFTLLDESVLSSHNLRLTPNGFRVTQETAWSKAYRLGEHVGNSLVNATKISPAASDDMPMDHVREPGPIAILPLADVLAKSSIVPASLEDAPSPERVAKVEMDLEQVFLVRGKDQEAVDALTLFLQFLRVGVLSWQDAVKLVGGGTPNTLDVIKAGMEHAGAVIVLFTPDDLARVQPDFVHPEDPLDANERGQARQNVTLEAGMAMMLAPDRTIFLKSGSTRPISDIAGINWIDMNGEWDRREDLMNRLKEAGVSVRPHGSNLLAPSAGPFRVEYDK